MNCPKCGKENPDNAQSCWFCHSVLTPVSPSSPALSVKTSGLAIASLVLGILAPFTCFLTAIPAVVLGIVALVKIGKSAGHLKGNGPAIAGICVPVVALPVIVLLLMGIMMPALAKVRQVSFRMVCATNMSALGKAMLIYAGTHNDMFPTPSKWCDLLIEHAEVPKSFICKGASAGSCNYAMNKNVEKVGIFAPPDMVLLFESKPGWNQSGGPEILTTENHQDDGCNIVFVDGHVQFVRTKDLKNLKWTTRENETSPPEPIPLPP